MCEAAAPALAESEAAVAEVVASSDTAASSIMDVADLEDSLAQCGSSDLRPVVHVEVCAFPTCTSKVITIKEHVRKLFEERKIISMVADTVIMEFDDPFLTENVISISISDSDIDSTDNRSKSVEVKNVNLLLHVYQLHSDGPATEELEGDDMSAASHWLLPSQEYHGMWESLVFDSDVKKQLLHYASTTLLFSSKEVNSNIITWNRVVLLHGPPGTGKTSLCKALAQKLCIRLSGRFRYGQLVEINSHGLFSKWFSESGKLVVKMFQKIKEIIEDPEALVCILIDEVESLTVARKSSLSGNEPSDAVRVVNALLTQIDQIKRNPNVLILTTSNITGAIDLAFVDRADIKQYIGPPSAAAIYKIYSSCIAELMRTGIVAPQHQLLELRTLEMMRFSCNAATNHSLRLWEISQSSASLSGRTLRKVPFLAHALYVQMPVVSIDGFLDAMEKTVQLQFKEREDLCKDT